MAIYPNFIILYLCNNDYGDSLERTAKILNEFLHQDQVLVSAERIKEIAVNLIAELNDLREASRGFSTHREHTRDYLRRDLEVVFSRLAPDQDHDGGSVAIDRHRGVVWRF